MAGCLRLLALTHPISFFFSFLLLLLKIYDLLSVKNWDNVVLLSSPPSWNLLLYMSGDGDWKTD